MNMVTWATAAILALFHPFYISMTDIKHNAKNKSLEVSVRIFTDDLENTLKKKCNCKVDLSSQGNRPQLQKLLNEYIASQLKIKVDGKPVFLEFLGYENEGGSTWNYFEVKDVPHLKKIELYNSLLHDLTESQVNMLHISANGKQQSDKLDYPKNTYSLTW